MTAARYIYNIDWLECYCIESRGAAYIEECRQRGFKVIIQPYGTRIYRQIVDILTENDVPLFHITREPYSVKGVNQNGVMKPNSAHIKLGNWCLYQKNYIFAFEQFLFQCGLVFQSISRVDVCCDLQSFEDGTLPATLLRGYIKGKYHKVGQSKFQAYGEDQGDKILNSMMWGSEKSAVHARMYNKTKELYEVKDKPYIRDQWQAAGFDMSRQTWRVEFEIHAKGRSIVEWEDGTVTEIRLSDLKDPQTVQELFHKYATHYFDWRKAKQGVRKDRCPKKLLFPSGEVEHEYHPYPNTRNQGGTRFERMVANFISREVEACSEIDAIDRLALLETRRIITARYRLTDWVKEKGTPAITKVVKNPLAERGKTLQAVIINPKINETS